MPGDTILKNISITVDGIVYVFVKDIWPAVDAAANAGKVIEFGSDEPNSPGRSADVLTTSPLIRDGLGDDVERKF